MQVLGLRSGMSGGRSLLVVGAFLLSLALLPHLVRHRPTTPPVEMRNFIQRQLDIVWSGQAGRIQAMETIAAYVATRSAEVAAALTQDQINQIAPLVLDADREIGRRALVVLSRIGPSAKPAADRVRAYLRTQPNLKFDRHAWDIEFGLRQPAESVATILQLTSMMRGRSPEEQSELARRIGMLASDVTAKDDKALAPAVGAISAILSHTDARYEVLSSAAFALGSLGPRARSAVPVLERALAAMPKATEFVVCAGFCPSLADDYERALKCIKLSSNEFDVARRFGGPCDFFAREGPLK